MSNKRLYITLGIMFISLTINGCSETPNSSIVPAFSDSVTEIEIPEPIDSLNDSTDTKIDTDKEIEKELSEVQDITVEDTSNFSGGEVDYSNEPWYVERIDYSNTNNGQGWDSCGKHFDTWGEVIRYENELHENSNKALTDEEKESLFNGGEIVK